MKTYHIPGLGCMETMTCAELREKLQEYPDDMPAFATWEMVLAPIHPDNFKHKAEGVTIPKHLGKCLIVDVEGH